MKTFEELALIQPIAQALSEANHDIPTAIQAKTIPHALNQRDVLGCAQTGTGKTAAFALPLLNSLGQRSRKSVPNQPFALVLAPTRELAGQIEQSFSMYGRHLKLRTSLVYGGVSQHRQVRTLNRGAHILIATPGRLLDLMEQRYIDLSQVSFLVLDEADRMLDMGFLPDVRRIIAKVPKQRQSLFFSATVTPKVLQFAKQLLNDPVTVNVTPAKTSVEAISQQVIHTETRDKKRLLSNILADPEVGRTVVFTRTKRGANAVAKTLQGESVKATAIHGNKSQSAREQALSDFRKGKIRVLVATDVASRGIDVEGITHVVNFDLPREPEAYIHRIGRTGRAGREGTAIAFCTDAERGELAAIERLIGHRIPVAENSVRRSTPRASSRASADVGTASSERRRRRPRRPGSEGPTASSSPRRHRRRRPNGSPARAR